MLQSHGVFFGQKLKIFYYLHRQDPLKFCIFFVKNMYLPPPPQKSSNLHESQELSGTLPQKLKSVKILKTFIHAI
jgi:hypothetical protein